MGSKCLIAILGIAILAVAIQAELANPVEDLINKLADEVEKLTAKALKDMENAVKNVTNVINKILDQFGGKAGEIVQPIIDKIANMTEAAISKGSNITSCAVNQTMEEIKELPDLILDHVKHCTSAITEEAKKMMDEGEKTIDKLVDQVRELAHEASKCGLLQPLCWANLAPKVAQLGLKIPVEIADTVGKIVKLIAELGVKVVACESDNLKDLTQEAMGLLKNVTECIKSNSNETLLNIDEAEYYY